MECVDGGSEPVDFETLFKLRLSDKLDTLFANDKDLPTQFVLVPSLRDVFHEFVFPQVRYLQIHTWYKKSFFRPRFCYCDGRRTKRTTGGAGCAFPWFVVLSCCRCCCWW